MPALGTPTLVTGEVDPASGGAEVIRDAVVAWEGGAFTFAGPRAGFDGSVDDEVPAMVPGFVDCHTHLPFYGWREDEYEARLEGRSYRDLHGEGGIARSARMLAEASDDEVLAFCRPLVAEMLAGGTTTMELKTGYGLSVEAELRQALLARRLGEETAQTTSVTLLACHAVPEGTERREWVDLACSELIPAAAREGLADAVDCYVEDIAFTLEDLAAVAEAAAGAGLPLRVHADQLGPSGAAEAAARLRARSADHLNHAGPEGTRALAAAGTTAVLLPASTLMLAAKPPPVADLLAAGARIAVASDFNPGTAPVLSMPLVLGLASALYRLDPLTALVGATASAARVLGLGDRVGRIAPGLRADLVVLDAPDEGMLAYRPGHDPIVQVVAGGQPVGTGPS